MEPGPWRGRYRGFFDGVSAFFSWKSSKTPYSSVFPAYGCAWGRKSPKYQKKGTFRVPPRVIFNPISTEFEPKSTVHRRRTGSGCSRPRRLWSHLVSWLGRPPLEQCSRGVDFLTAGQPHFCSAQCIVPQKSVSLRRFFDGVSAFFSWNSSKIYPPEVVFSSSRGVGG